MGSCVSKVIGNIVVVVNLDVVWCVNVGNGLDCKLVLMILLVVLVDMIYIIDFW